MQDKSINGALIALRKNIIRGDLDGLAHVEALLALRSVELPRVMPPKRKDVAGKGRMSLWVLSALQDGPKPMREVVAHVAVLRPELGHKAVYVRTGQALNRLKRKGMVSLERRLWGLAQ